MKIANAAHAPLKCCLILAAALSFGASALARRPNPSRPAQTSPCARSPRDCSRPSPGETPDYSNHDLTYLDLSGLNFKGAKLAKSNLYGADFTDANLRGTDMSGTRLDRRR